VIRSLRLPCYRWFWHGCPEVSPPAAIRRLALPRLPGGQPSRGCPEGSPPKCATKAWEGEAPAEPPDPGSASDLVQALHRRAKSRDCGIAKVGVAKSGSGSLSESVSKGCGMGFGHEKLDVYRTAIEYVVWV
jgi:hypothetical protein